jgi:alcohol dehydrogenase
LLAPIVRWNSAVCSARYREIHPDLPRRLDELAAAAGLPRRVAGLGVSRDDLAALAVDAAEQWTGRFNPRSFDAAAAREIYECAW